ncbi:MAG TPA: beta-galactosidase, partial [Acidobacteriaceae bacterium]
MGEFHYSRVPQQNWETEILKMKAGGVEVISTYVIWIHHEEVESQFDWTGRRNLRAFVLLCAKHGMLVYLRIGPWVHGETRNGGIPDWAMQRSPVRRDDPTYLAEVGRYFGEVGQQLASQFWSEGGPVIGIQLENEYMRGEKPGTGDDHIRSLKRIAMEAGLDTPLYTVTGWGRTAIPLDAVLPVYGAYPDAPWDGSPDQLPPNEAYDFRTANRASGNMGIVGDAEQNGAATYQGTPFLTAEVGGGMQDTYFRRPVISADDVAAVPTVLIGSGANSLGFYMYHGGRNPNGKLSTLQESQITDYPTDVPVKSYDFQAPIGEFGQERESFRRLKLMNYFLNEFGSLLAPMSPRFPSKTPSGPADLSVARVAARVAGNQGFIFFNNYVRGTSMPDRPNFSVDLKLPTGTVSIPENPLRMPPGAYGVWPVNFDLNGYRLQYSTAELFHRFTIGADTWFCFFAIPGVEPEFALTANRQPSFLSPTLRKRSSHGMTYITTVNAGASQQAIYERGSAKIHILLLSREQAEALWRIPGLDAPLLTTAQVFADEKSVTLQSDGTPEISFSLLASCAAPASTVPLIRETASAIFDSYRVRFKPAHFSANLIAVSQGEPRSPLVYGKSFSWRRNPLPLAPGDEEFERGAHWTLNLPESWGDDLSDVYLTIHYKGDIARLSAEGHLLDDDFWNGMPW